jgi:membrane protease YdiL (CAAX protease family)
MTFFDDNPADGAHESNGSPTPSAPLASVAPALAEVPPGDPFTYGATHPQPYKFVQPAGDLDIPWSWGHLVCFVLFGFISLLLVQVSFTLYYAQGKGFPSHPSEKEFQQFILSKPGFAIGSMVLWYALLFLFLYVTLTVIYGSSFWKTLGWKKLSPLNSKAPAKPWLYLVLGCSLSVLVMIVTATAKAPEHAPIQDILKNRNMAFAFMGMAVLIAPLVEETIFRGYLYPLFAKSFGIAPGIIITGILFGLMHGYQLGWAWALVLTLIGVGIVFTVVRARAETVVASFLMHLGYNSTIAILSTLALIFAKYGKLPVPHP